MTVALKNGVNFFDNAEIYASGKSETVMGKIFQRWFADGLCKRSDIVVSTKLFGGTPQVALKGNPNSNGLSRKHIIEGLAESLQRLQLDYVDVLFCHRPGILLEPPVKLITRCQIRIAHTHAFVRRFSVCLHPRLDCPSP